jgi:voltage-gated potassium channel Kch
MFVPWRIRSMKPRIIVCGLGRTGYKIFCLLKQQGASVVGISDRPIAGEPTTDIILGDPRSPVTLINAGLADAETLVLAWDDDALNLEILTRSRLLNPRIRVIDRLFNETLGERLDRTLPDHVSMSVSQLAAPIFSFAARGNQAIGQLHLFDRSWPIQEIIIDENHPWQGLPLYELWDDPTRMLIYYLPARDEIDLISAIILGKRLQRGDHLIIGTRPTPSTRRRFYLRRFLKRLLNFRPYQHYARPVLLVLLSLLTMIGVATLTYISVNTKVSLVDALYFSVGMITGAGGNEKVAESTPDSVKLFTILMMIVGAGVVGLCYALLNDFILGSRFKQFWDATRIPARDHHIVCGLGGVGTKIIQELQANGCEVVAIEADPDNRFLHTVRSLSIPVIIEDARLPSTLMAANLSKAASLIVVTSQEMVNVEIGLTAKEIAPKLTLIVRAGEEELGRSIQEVFEFDAVLCPTELAAYSFAAAALGGRILGNGMTDDLLWVAIATLITPNHPFYDRVVKEIAMVADFVPLYLERQGTTVHGWSLLDILLTDGDVIYLTMPATRLEQLWKTRSNLFLDSPAITDS